jgi:hypothetical protein
MYTRYLFSAIGLIFFGSQYINAQNPIVWHVSANAVAGGNGLSWSTAFDDLHQAMQLAQKGDAIWVKEGTYLPDSAGDRSQRFELPSGVKLYGGFAGWETAVNQRMRGVHTSILSGNVGNPADSTDNSFTILYLNFPDSSTLIDGFSLRHGYAVSDTAFNNTGPTKSGAAVYVNAAGGYGLPTFLHCKFEHHVAASNGAAFYVRGLNTLGSTPVFQHCTFFDNFAYRNGGAVYLWGGNEWDRGIEFDHCVFEKNTCLQQAGGIYVQKNIGGREQIDIVNTIIENNSTDTDNILGSFWVEYVTGDLRHRFSIDSCTIYNNVTSTVLFFFDGLNFSPVSIFIKNSVFKENSSIFEFYPASDLHPDTIVINNVIFESNTWLGQLHAEKNKQSFVQIKGCTFNGQSAVLSSAEFSFCNNTLMNNTTSAFIHYLQETTFRGLISNNLFINNHTNEHLIDLFYLPDNKVEYLIVNNTFSDNNLAGQKNDNLPVRSIFTNNIINNTEQSGCTNCLPVNLDIDSMMLSHNLFDNYTPLDSVSFYQNFNQISERIEFLDTATFDFRLAPCSPGIDAGWDSIVQVLAIQTDLTGGVRILGDHTDIGAFELPLPGLSAEPSIIPTCANASTGAVRFDVDYACPPLQYLWERAGVSDTTTQLLSAGDYLFTVTDSRNRKLITPVSISSNEAPEVAAVVTPASGMQVANGSINFNVLAGFAPFHFLWNTGDTTASVDSLLPADYQLLITDGAGCTYVYLYTVGFSSAAPQPYTMISTQVVPNPANDQIWLHYPQPGLWQLYSTSGRMFLEVTVTHENTPVDIKTLPTGVYVYRMVYANGRKQCGRLCIMR